MGLQAQMLSLVLDGRRDHLEALGGEEVPQRLGGEVRAVLVHDVVELALPQNQTVLGTLHEDDGFRPLADASPEHSDEVGDGRDVLQG